MEPVNLQIMFMQTLFVKQLAHHMEMNKHIAAPQVLELAIL